MPKFQGSGFAVELPEGLLDFSTYTYVLPVKSGFSPNLVIRFELVQGKPDLIDYVKQAMDRLSENLDAFELINQASGKRGGCDGVMNLFEWGEGKGRMRQKQIFLLTAGKKQRIYTLTTLDLAANSAASDPAFERILRSFTPNELQCL
ncbi:MAG: DcrB-related protein [Candidatus Polarisedimenticolaceae bacterium]|nr:DcrB-related protein [Candidatus Polarisedimenticolaceae bacterium]